MNKLTFLFEKLECHQRHQVMLTIRVTDKSHKLRLRQFSWRCSRINKGGSRGPIRLVYRVEIEKHKEFPLKISKADLSFHHIRFGYGREYFDNIRLEQLVAFKLRLDKIKKEVKGDILADRLKLDSNVVLELDKGENSGTR
ncbi:hypothetical protein RND71_028529 [Anisodus tanguticus]|uniref:Uncharacterized protein n=1 Tax=Anisodus tanguticus TaxID=243964 RepID=A0AAE1RJX4_9SOLA|nr:hypothetical protein RND71_028529 [Anisodus tanguticus]